MTEFDIVISGGTVIDGTGATGQPADVGIVGDRIAAIGRGLKGTEQVDASGCVVAPGFIDIHTHYDAQVFWDPALTPSSFHGVTTVVAGNCGFTIAPTDDDLGDLIARTLERVEDMDVEALRAGIPHDAGAHVGQLCDASQATDLLANWVRDRGVVSLETAVRRLSGLQADIFNFTDRGYLRTGGYADVVVFDPGTVAPGPTRRVHDFPANSSRLTADRPIGIRHVFVNGTAIGKDEVALDLEPEALPGHVIAPAKRA